MTDQPKGRSMKELRAIIAEETARRDRLIAALDVISDGAQDRLMEHALDLIAVRLEEIRTAINAESVSYGELADLQGLADYIQTGDVQLAEWAGIPEEEFANR